MLSADNPYTNLGHLSEDEPSFRNPHCPYSYNTRSDDGAGLRDEHWHQDDNAAPSQMGSCPWSYDEVPPKMPVRKRAKKGRAPYFEDHSANACCSESLEPFTIDGRTFLLGMGNNAGGIGREATEGYAFAHKRQILQTLNTLDKLKSDYSRIPETLQTPIYAFVSPASPDLEGFNQGEGNKSASFVQLLTMNGEARAEEDLDVTICHEFVHRTILHHTDWQFHAQAELIRRLVMPITRARHEEEARARYEVELRAQYEKEFRERYEEESRARRASNTQTPNPQNQACTSPSGTQSSRASTSSVSASASAFPAEASSGDESDSGACVPGDHDEDSEDEHHHPIKKIKKDEAVEMDDLFSFGGGYGRM